MSKSLKLIIESLLFSSEKPLTIKDIRSCLPDTKPNEIKSTIEVLKYEFEAMGRSFELKEVAQGFQFRSRVEYGPYILRMFQSSPDRLSSAAMETLAIVAYKQPILRHEIERLRGVDVGGILRTLLEKGLIRIMGRKDLPGRPLIYGTSKLFLETFDLKDISSLPKIKEIKAFGADEYEPSPNVNLPVFEEKPDLEAEKDTPSSSNEQVVSTNGEYEVQDEATNKEALKSETGFQMKNSNRYSHKKRTRNQNSQIKKSLLDQSELKNLPTTDTTKPQRINKLLSLAGITSRRKADDLIKLGAVTLNGQIVKELGTKGIWGTDSIRVEGKEIQGPSNRIYIMLNKPFGYISSLNDPEGRPLAVDLLKQVTQRVYSIGRLDFNSLGLLIFTNDGEFTHRLAHPRFHVPKTYKVTIKGLISGDNIKSLQKGVLLEDGFSGISKTVLLRQFEGKSLLRITITKGKKRLVRRMVEAVGHDVIHLIRTSFGSLELGSLKIGDFRFLEPEEITGLKKMVGLL